MANQSIQEKINQAYNGMTKAAEKAAFVRRLKEAGLPLPERHAKAKLHDSLIADLLNMQAAESKPQPQPSGKKAA